jgi:hypothetical protein
MTSEGIVAKGVALIEDGMIKGLTPNCVCLAEHSINHGKNVWHLWTTSDEAILDGAGSEDQITMEGAWDGDMGAKAAIQGHWLCHLP